MVDNVLRFFLFSVCCSGHYQEALHVDANRPPQAHQEAAEERVWCCGSDETAEVQARGIPVPGLVPQAPDACRDLRKGKHLHSASRNCSVVVFFCATVMFLCRAINTYKQLLPVLLLRNLGIFVESSSPPHILRATRVIFLLC